MYFCVLSIRKIAEFGFHVGRPLVKWDEGVTSCSDGVYSPRFWQCIATITTSEDSPAVAFER